MSTILLVIVSSCFFLARCRSWPSCSSSCWLLALLDRAPI
jgi:hypothetical protein